MLQSIRASSLSMPTFGHNIAIADGPKMDEYAADTDSWQWPQHSTIQAPSQNYTPIFDPALYAHLAPSLPVPGSPWPRAHSIATSHVMNTGTSTPPPQRHHAAGGVVKAQPAFKPTWHGFLDSTKDAMTIVEAALQGRLSHISRRPHDKERAEMLTSGTILVYEENASGIKRWTDAVHWSPSRVMNNCLIYRQLVRALKPEEKKSALNSSSGSKRKRKESADASVTKTGENVNNSEDEYENSTFDAPDASSTEPMGKVYANFAQNLTPDQQRRFCGSLIDSYEFKEGGLMKKTISVKYQGTTHHIISYYSLEDVVAGKLKRPCQDPTLADIQPRPDLLMGWKVSLEDEDSKDLPVVAVYSHQLQPSHIQHQQHLGAATQSMGTHGIVQSHTPIHLQIPDYYSYTPTHQSPQNYAQPHSTASHYTYQAHRSSPQHYTSQSAEQYSQAPSPQSYAPQSALSQQYPSPATSIHQYTPQTTISSQQIPAERKVAPVSQYQQPTAPTYTGAHSSQITQSSQYAIPHAPGFGMHMSAHPSTSPEDLRSQSTTPRDSYRRASAPVTSQNYSQSQFQNFPQGSYYFPTGIRL